ncbi:hypothetical protein H8S95_04295 [Pontibacter sp. KCTC 32443]|uniref:hypothetical protein n=1 Tax=Pontibacter TaxID=323449 RepID=UPI00164D53D7|nr:MULTISPECIES: hypothetical protein [Pontibacter]MBC5773275.1 hypothetical protein [Pontibacter sp. KCTC 32443]
MLKYISKPFAIYGILVILSLMVAFHTAILVGLIPYEMVWGGRLNSYSEMLRFEAISVTLNLVMIAVVVVYAGLFKLKIPADILKIALWAMFTLFLMNTVGNFFSINFFEKIIFTPLTFILSFLSLKLAVTTVKTSAS